MYPRFGFAYDVFGDGRTSIRGAYGLFGTQDPAVVSSIGNETSPFLLTLSIPAPPSLANPFAGSVNPFPYDVTRPSFPDFPLAVTYLDPDLKVGYVQQFNLNLQQQLQEWVVQVGYVGSLRRSLTSGSRNINTAQFRPGATARNIQERRPLPQFGNIDGRFSDLNSQYNFFQVSAKKRFSQGYTFQLAYTYSKSIDQRSEDVGPAVIQDPSNYHDGQRGLSDFYQKHILALNGVWDIPAVQNSGALSYVVRDWQLAGKVRLASGTPFTVESGRDIRLNGFSFQRPHVIGEGRLDPGRPTGDRVARFFNTQAFALPNTGEFGNAGRNILVGPGFHQTDLAINRRFPLGSERLGRIEFRTEIFNLFNNTNFNNPNAVFTSPAFSKLLTSQDARIVQFALRWDF